MNISYHTNLLTRIGLEMLFGLNNTILNYQINNVICFVEDVTLVFRFITHFLRNSKYYKYNVYVKINNFWFFSVFLLQRFFNFIF